MTQERRLAHRVTLRIPLRFRPLPNPTTMEQKAESVNISEKGVYFATDFPLKVGTSLELFLNMPQEITGKSPTAVRCTARVVHVQPKIFAGNKSGVGVHIEQYEAVSTAERWAS